MLRVGMVLGYPRVQLWTNNQKRSESIHRLMWEAWVGPIPDGMEINHIDGDPANFALNNLEVVSHAENMAHARNTGLMKYDDRWRRNQRQNTKRGAAQHAAKLTDAAVLNIKASIAAGETLKALSAAYSVHVETLRDIKLGKTWKHVLTPPQSPA